MKNTYRLIIVTLAAGVFTAAAENELGDVALHQALLDLGTDLRLMCVAAHPDDEDSSSLAMYRKKWGYKTFALIATRGEGGQNEIGPELYNELAVLRTDEMKRASEITGAETHFLDLPEFGFSKTDEETYEIWGRDECTKRLVRKIRELKPDVIISHHGPEGGHGHHQVVGISLLEAFDMAGDAKAFPEQIAEGLAPWQVARFYVRPFGSAGGRQGESVTNDTSELDPIRGYTYSEIAGQALFEHKSQGMGFFVERFQNSRSTTTYFLQKEASAGTSGGGDFGPPGGGLFEGLKDRVSQGARDLSTKGPAQDDTFGPALALLGGDIAQPDKARANSVASIAAKLRLRAKISDEEAAPGQSLTITTELFDYGTKDASAVTFSIESAAWMPTALPEPKTIALEGANNRTAEFKVTVPDNQASTLPHPDMVFKPHFLDPQFIVVASVKMTGGQVVEVRQSILIDVAPAVSVEFADAPYLVRAGESEASLAVLITNHSPGALQASVTLIPPKGFSLQTDVITIPFEREGDQKLVPITAAVASELKPRDYEFRATVGGIEAARGTARLIDVSVPRDIHVGVVQSYDDTFMKTLSRLKVPHEALGLQDFVPARLDEFSTIVVDIRAYLVREDLRANNQALLDYVQRGGTVIVNYHKNFEWEPSFGPYPIELSRNRVTVEQAPITLLVPDHPLFNAPNKIVPSDWDNWIQERGLYFPGKWVPEYTPLIEVQDPGENNPPGACLIAKYGEGTYMYTALGWYRQLRELHPGTLRIFANMLAL